MGVYICFFVVFCCLFVCGRGGGGGAVPNIDPNKVLKFPEKEQLMPQTLLKLAAYFLAYGEPQSRCRYLPIQSERYLPSVVGHCLHAVKLICRTLKTEEHHCSWN